jgi:MoaA/NifB/PqqE/SkfB family radical SAM enzyme
MDVDLLRPRISSVAIEVSSRCNLRCVYCHKADDVLEAHPAANMDMTDAMVRQLYRSCKAAGIRQVTLSVGGETTVVAEWYARLAEFLDDPEIEAGIVSNFARMLDEDELVAFTKFRTLQVSFDSADWDMVRKLRSKADLRTIAFNITRLRQKARELGRGPFIIVNCTVCRDNIGHIEGLAGFCRELGVDQLMLCDMVILSNNSDRPEPLDALTPAELDLLASQVAAADRILQGSETALNVRARLQSRIDGRDGTGNSETSSCRMPWTSPLVMADGRVIACCGGHRLEVGNLATATLAEIVDGERYRAVRKSILAGQPIVTCRGCALAQRKSYEEFIRDIREWQGNSGARQYESQVERVAWPGLLSAAEHPILVENGILQIGEGGAATLIEDTRNGLHRCLFDLAAPTTSEITFVTRPAGRRRLRLDLAQDGAMVARAQILLASRPVVDVPIGNLDCRVTALDDGRFRVSAAVRDAKAFSHVNLSLTREDGALLYRGDGRSGVTIAEVALAP